MVRSILQYWVSIVLYIITAGSVNVGGGCHTQMVGLTWPHRVLWLSNGGWSLAPRKAFEGLGNPIHQGFCPRSCQMPPHFPHNPNHISPNVGYNVITHILGTRVRKTSGGPHLPICVAWTPHPVNLLSNLFESKVWISFYSESRLTLGC